MPIPRRVDGQGNFPACRPLAYRDRPAGSSCTCGMHTPATLRITGAALTCLIRRTRAL
jgi:hypothetical protein